MSDDENIYSFLWDKTDSYAYWVGGPAVWKHTALVDDYFPGEILIEDGFKRIGENITVNDFFFFAEISHGYRYPELNGGGFRICTIVDIGAGPQINRDDFDFSLMTGREHHPNLKDESGVVRELSSASCF